MKRTILHVDMDAFYASVEQRDNHELRGKPLVVGGTGPRGVVAAASYEVRRYGVHSAMPMRDALRRCPQAVCVRPRMQVYRAESKKIFAVFRRFTPVVQGLSLDEAFLDMTGGMAAYADPPALGQAVKQEIFAATGLTASVGIAPNKLVAKIASDLDKPDGLTHVPTERVQAVLDPLPTRSIPGLGPKAAERLEHLGIHTVADLRRAPVSQLTSVFGRFGQMIRQRAAGVDDRPVIEQAQEQSISVEETFDTDERDPKRLQSLLMPMADKVAARVRAKGYVAGLVTVKIRSADFATATRQRLCRPPSAESAQLGGIAADLLAEWLAEHPEVAVRLLGVGGGRLRRARQLDLFAAPSRGEQLDETVDEIQDRFGAGTLRRGSSLE